MANFFLMALAVAMNSGSKEGGRAVDARFTGVDSLR
jgi:hypothetical protein